MNKKIISFWMIFTSLFSLLFWYSLVFAWNSDQIFFQESEFIFPDALKLNKVRYIIKSKTDFSDWKISSSCDFNFDLVSKQKNFYVIDVSLSNYSKCKYNDLKLSFNSWETTIDSRLKVYTKTDTYSQFLDNSDSFLEKSKGLITSKISELDKMINNPIDLLDKMKNERKKSEIQNIESVLSDILFQRSLKYNIPVNWYKLPTTLNKVPNTWRPYRESYTDWIHHGWDIDAPLWTNVVSIDDWIIIRVVNWFKYTDLNNIVYWNNISDEQKTLNLDVLRWNQVWIKTMKWDVVFYSHLNEIYSNIEEWYFVKRWEPIWTVWATWVPDKNYEDYHLHFPIHKNPLNDSKKSDYTNLDIMNWDWYFKDLNPSEIIEEQYKIFD